VPMRVVQQQLLKQSSRLKSTHHATAATKTTLAESDHKNCKQQSSPNNIAGNTKNLTSFFAADAVGDGNNYIVGSFQVAQNRFYSRRIMSICASKSGEIGDDFENVIKRLAMEKASGYDGIRISPLVNRDRKGGAFPIILQQFRKGIGSGIVRGQVKHKLGRLLYIKATSAEVAADCRRYHSKYGLKPSQNGRASRSPAQKRNRERDRTYIFELSIKDLYFTPQKP